MKKIALILTLVLSLTLTFAACSNNTEKTNTSVRWRSEEYLFNIGKASFTEEDVTVGDKTFMYEPVTSGYEQLPENMDEVSPENIGGTYKMTITVHEAEKTCTFKTVQTMYCQYETATLQNSSAWDQLKDLVVAADSEENPFTEHDGLTTLKSTNAQTVTFKNEASQRPLSSETHVDGYYVGKVHQERSKYDVATTYDWENNVAKVTLNGEVQENKLSVSSTVNFIDSNQILLYARSLDKASTSFQDSPSVQIYVPAQNTLKVASFGFTHSCNTILNVEGEEVYATVNALAVIVDSHAFIVQLSVPDSVNEVESLDSVSNAGSGDLDKYSLLRFRSGIIRYELADYTQIENGAKILDAISYDVPVDEE